jgi:hypothetical protein
MAEVLSQATVILFSNYIFAPPLQEAVMEMFRSQLKANTKVDADEIVYLIVFE